MIKTLTLISLLFVTADVPELINDLGEHRWSVRNTATVQLREMLDDPEVYRALRESMQGELSPEAESRHRNLVQDYYRRVEHLYEKHSARVYLAGERAELYVPAAFIWSLPRELRFEGERDVAAELYERAAIELNVYGYVTPEGQTNHDVTMRYATHLFVVDWLESFKSHADLQAVYDETMRLQESERVRLNEHLSSVGFNGRREMSVVPVAIEDREGETCVCPHSRNFYFMGTDGGDL